MASSVIFPDIELFLTGWYQAALDARPEEFCHNFEVVDREPDYSTPFPDRVLVVRSDGITRTSVVTGSAAIGLSVLAGSKFEPGDAINAARVVMALAEQLPSAAADNPVAAVNGSAGPFIADENQQRARRYVTLELSITGDPF